MADKERKILLGLTTTPGSDWRGKVREIEKFSIREISLFPTFLAPNERKELYALLQKTQLARIPHVHLRSDDMELWELDYFTEKYGTEVFNAHAVSGIAERFSKTKYWNRIFLENMYGEYSKREGLTEKLMEKQKPAGICLDFTHLEEERRNYPEDYRKTVSLFQRYPIGCNHISAIMEKKYIDPYDGMEKFDSHTLRELKNLDYLKNYPLRYFSNYLAVELENKFSEQLKAKEYIEGIINKML